MIEPRIVVNNRMGTFFIRPVDVLFIQAQGSYSVIKLMDGTEIKLSTDIKNIPITPELAPCFVRTHRSWLVNINHISRIESNNKLVILVDATKIPATESMCRFIISRYKVQEDLDSDQPKAETANDSFQLTDASELDINDLTTNEDLQQVATCQESIGQNQDIEFTA